MSVRLIVFVQALAWVLLWSSLCQADTAKVDPKNYRLVLDNDKVRVMEIVGKPGQGICGSGKHWHPPHLVIAQTPSKAEVTLADAKTFIAEMKTGDVYWDPGGWHKVINRGNNEVRALIVELKPIPAATAQ